MTLKFIIPVIDKIIVYGQVGPLYFSRPEI